MKLIIAGGRDYKLTVLDLFRLGRLSRRVTEVVSGGASGADYEGEGWAYDHNIPVRRFPALWDKHGKAAGPIRNKQMAQYADAVVLFKGGKGTDNMYREARAAGIAIYDYRKK